MKIKNVIFYFLSVLLVVVFYTMLHTLSDREYFLFIGLFCLIYVIFPNEATLFLTPSLIPTLNLDLGIGISVLRFILISAMFGQIIRGDWFGKKTKLLPKPLILGWLFIFFGLGLSFIYNGDKLFSEFGIWLGRLFWMIIYFVAWQKKPNIGYYGWIFAGVLALIAALYIFLLTGNVLSVRYISGFHTNSFEGAAYLILAVSIFAVVSFWSIWILYIKKKMPLLISLLLSTLLAFPIIFSGRRQAVYGLIVSIMIMLIFLPIKGKIKALIFIGLFFLAFSNSRLIDDFFRGRETILEEIAGQGTGRFQIYEAGVKGFLEKPIIGWGPGHYPSVMREYGVLLFNTDIGVSSHNTILTLAVEGGILSLIGMINIVVYIGLTTIKINHIDPAQAKLALGIKPFIYALAGYLMIGLATSNFIELLYYLLPATLIVAEYDLFGAGLDDQALANAVKMG